MRCFFSLDVIMNWPLYRHVRFAVVLSLHSLIQAFVHCRLDYCNSTLAGVAKVYLQKSQLILSFSSLSFLCTSCTITLKINKVSAEHGCSWWLEQVDVIASLQFSSTWLLVYPNSLSKKISVFKTALMVWKRIHGVAVAYLSDLCIPVTTTPGREKVRSDSNRILLVPHVRTAAGSEASPAMDRPPGTVCHLI